MNPNIGPSLCEESDRPFGEKDIDFEFDAIFKISGDLAKLDAENVNGHDNRKGFNVIVSPKLDSRSI